VSGYSMAARQVKLTGSAVRKVTFALCSTILSIVHCPAFKTRNGTHATKTAAFPQRLSKIEFRPRGLESANVQVDSYLQKKIR
jgi:hypothetical protein